MFWKCLFFLFLIKVGHQSCAWRAAGDGCDHHICRYYYKTEWDRDRRGNNKVVFTLNLIPDFNFSLTECFFFLVGGGEGTVFWSFTVVVLEFLWFSDLFLWQSIYMTYPPWIVVLEQCETLSICLLSHSSERKHVLTNSIPKLRYKGEGMNWLSFQVFLNLKLMFFMVTLE